MSPKASAGAHLDRVLAGTGWRGVVETVRHAAELRLEIEPGRDTLDDPDLDATTRGFHEDRTMRHLVEADVAVRGLRDHRGAGSVDDDVAVRGGHAEVSGDVTDPSVAVRIPDHSRSVDAADPDRAGARRHVGIAAGLVNGDVTDTRLEPHRARPGDVDVARTRLEGAFGETPRRVKFRYRHVARYVRARRKIDPNIDRLAAPPERLRPPSLRPLDQQPAVRVLDPSLLGGGHVGLLRAVARSNLDDRVGAVTRLDPNVTDGELDRHEDGFGSFERVHSRPSARSAGAVSAPIRCIAVCPSRRFERDARNRRAPTWPRPPARARS